MRAGVAEGRAEGLLVPSTCTAPAKGATPDTLSQSAPSWQGPEHVEVVSPRPPKNPRSHRPLQALLLRPVVSPYVPAGQGRQAVREDCPVRLLKVPRPQGRQSASAPLPVKVLTVPTGHAFCVALVEPAPHQCPAAQLSCVELVEPARHQEPAEHCPEQAEVIKPLIAPYLPAAHSVAVPLAHQYPAEQDEGLAVPPAHASPTGQAEPPGSALPAGQ